MSKKLDKNLEKTRRKILREEYHQHNPYHSEGLWEELNLENNSYYDIDILEKVNAKTSQGIKYWEGRYKNASSWLGKWYCQVRINKLKEKLYHYENKS